MKKILYAIIMLVMVSCQHKDNCQRKHQNKLKIETIKSQYSKSGIISSVHTIVYEGHTYMVFLTYSGMGVIHHPECCNK